MFILGPQKLGNWQLYLHKIERKTKQTQQTNKPKAYYNIVRRFQTRNCHSSSKKSTEETQKTKYRNHQHLTLLFYDK